MDLDKLQRDWKTEPNLRYAACVDVADLAEQLVKAHRTLMGPNSGLYGYLYQQQVRRLREQNKHERE